MPDALSRILVYTDQLARPRALLADVQATLTPEVMDLLEDLHTWHTETVPVVTAHYGDDLVLAAVERHLLDVISTLYGPLIVLGPRGKRHLGVRSGTLASTTPDAAASHLYRRRALCHLEGEYGLEYAAPLDHAGRVHRTAHTMRDRQGKLHVVMASRTGYAPATIRRTHQGMFARLILEQAELILVIPDRRRTWQLERRPGYRLRVIPFRLPRAS